MEPVVEKLESSEERSDRVPAAEVRKALPAILQSSPFHASKQCQELLLYIVENTLAGHFEMLKERIIGAQVFGRPSDYATNDDPIVRARAGEVRKRLALYYQTAREQTVRISIPSGSFRAVFAWADRNALATPPATQAAQPASQPPFDSSTSPLPPAAQELTPIPSKSWRRTWWFVLAVTIIVTAWAMARYFAPPGERAFRQFWSPVLDSPHPTLIYVGGNAVYQLSASYLDEYYREHPRSEAEEMGYESYIPLPPGGKIDVQELYPAKDIFVTIGDVAAITRIESLLVRRQRQFTIRYGGDLAYGDLRESPAILIGAHNNSWTLAMTGNLRYVFEGRNAIVDRKNPHQRWTTTATFPEDYAVVSRVLNSNTGRPVFTAAGIGFAGTQAAGEFITTQQAIAALAKALPKGWETRNLQIVLHTTVTNQLPSAADVVATYCW